MAIILCDLHLAVLGFIARCSQRLETDPVRLARKHRSLLADARHQQFLSRARIHFGDRLVPAAAGRDALPPAGQPVAVRQHPGIAPGGREPVEGAIEGEGPEEALYFVGVPGIIRHTR